jgi:hypothetical protein
MENILIKFYTGNDINNNNNSWEQKNPSNPIFNPETQNLSRSYSMPYRYPDSNFENSNIFQTTGNMMFSSPDPYRIQMLEERVRELELKSNLNNLKYPNSFEPNVLNNQNNFSKNVPLYFSINEPQYLYERYFNLRPIQEFNNFRRDLKKRNPYRKGVKKIKNEKSNEDMYLIAESFNILKNELQKKIIEYERKHNEEFNDLKDIILNRYKYNNENENEEKTENNETNTNKSPSYKSDFNNNLENNLSQKVSSSKITSRMISFNDDEESKSKDRIHNINYLNRKNDIPQYDFNKQNIQHYPSHKTNKSSLHKKNKKQKKEYSENKSNSIPIFNINSENNSNEENENEENEDSNENMLSYHDKENEKSDNQKHHFLINKNRRRDIPINYIGDNMKPYQINKMPSIKGKEKINYKKQNNNNDSSINSKMLSFHDKENEKSNDREHVITFNNIRNRNPLIRNENIMNNNNNGQFENNNEENNFLIYEGQ